MKKVSGERREEGGGEQIQILMPCMQIGVRKRSPMIREGGREKREGGREGGREEENLISLSLLCGRGIVD